MIVCDWCAGSDSDAPRALCEMHRAEFLGLSMAEMHRGESIRHAEWRDAV